MLTATVMARSTFQTRQSATSTATLTDGSANPGNTGTLVYSSFDTFAAVPEPSTWVMVLGGAGMLIGFVQRRCQS